MNPTGCICVLFMLVFDVPFLTTVKGGQVVLDSPQFIHGLVYLNRQSTTHWSVRGNSIHSCPSAGSLIDAYYVLPHVRTSLAKEVVIDIAYTLYCCSHILTVSLYTLGTSSSVFIPPDPRNASYQHVTDITNTSTMWQSSTQVFTTRNYVAVEGYPYLYIAFRTQGFCGSVDAMIIHYYKCPSVSKNLVSYPETPAPRRESKSVQISGRCMQQSFPATTASANTMICYPNGTSKVTGGCQCMAGYQNISDSKCLACPPKTFKPSAGNYPCNVCGANVVNGTHPRTMICQCKASSFRPRAYSDAFHVNCEEPPSEPTNVNIGTISSTLVTLNWSRPNKTGTGDDIWYSIRFETKSFKSFTESIILTGLSPYTWYNVTISSKNNVTIATGVSRAISFSFVTSEGLPSMVRDLTYKQNDNKSVTVHWKEPKVKGSNSLSYAVRVNKDPLKIIYVTNHTIEQKEVTMHYNVTVMAHTRIGFSKSQSVRFSISGRTVTQSSLEGNFHLASVLIGVGIVLAVLLISWLMILLYRCSKRLERPPLTGHHPQPGVSSSLPPSGVDRIVAIAQSESSGSTAGSRINEAFASMEESTRSINDGHRLREITHPEPTGSTTDGQRNRLITQRGCFGRTTDMRRKLSIQAIHKETEIDGNFFGYLERPNQQHAQIFAKKCEKGSIDENFALELLKLQHPNVVSFEGILYEAENDFAVFEAVANGPLDKYLLKQRIMGAQYTATLLEMALGVANGMAYLSRKKHVHKHLKAGNILVGKNETCKISGLSPIRKLLGDPVRLDRASLDDLQHRLYTSQSDVWSYGILLWEIMSFGENPDSINHEAVPILPRPEMCSEGIYKIMKSCWERNAENRPNFDSICIDLSCHLALRINPANNQDYQSVDGVYEEPVPIHS